jgi:hypothetical protein
MRESGGEVECEVVGKLLEAPAKLTLHKGFFLFNCNMEAMGGF